MLPPRLSQRFATLPPRLSLRAILILAFVMQIAGAVGLVGYLSFRNGQKAVNNLATQLRQELTARIESKLQSYFETPHEINRLNAFAFARGDLDVINAQDGESQLYQQMKIAPNIAFVYCGGARQGEFFGVLRSPDDGSLQLSYGNESNEFLRDYYRLDVNGDRTYLLRRADTPYDSRQRPWYEAAVRSQGPAWTDVYIAFTTGLPNITASVPVYNRTGRRLLGVCATDVVLPEEFRNFLRDLEIGQTGQAFVIDRQGNLISNSTDEPLMVGEGSAAKSLKAFDSQDPLVSGTAQYLADRFSGFKSITQPVQLDFMRQGQRQFLEVVPFRDPFGLDWLIVVVVPEADFMAQINANTRNTVLLCLGALGVAIAIGILAARWISRPILRVAQASEAIAQGDLNQHINSTAIREIERMAQSFNSMSTQLKDSFESLRQSEAANRAIVATMPDLLIRATGDGIYRDIVGSDRLRAVHSIETFHPGTHVRDSLPPEAAELRLHYIQKALQTGMLQVYEHRLTVGDLSLDEEIRILVLAENEVLIIVRDITKRKRAEEALRIAEENYRSIYENALEGIFQSDPDGYFISVNPAMAQIYGYDSPQDMVKNITDIRTQIYVNPADRQEFEIHLDKDDYVKDFEYEAYQKDGSTIWIHEDTRAVRDNHGNLMYYEGIVRDITETRRQKEYLKQQMQALQVEIDQQQLEQQVSQITQSDYFQEIRKAVERIRLDDFWG